MLSAGSTESPLRSTESSRRPAEPPATNPVDRSFRAARLRALVALLGLVALVIISTPSPPRDPLLAALGALFSPERGRVLGNAISLFAAIVELAGVALFLAVLIHSVAERARRRKKPEDEYQHYSEPPRGQVAAVLFLISLFVLIVLAVAFDTFAKSRRRKA